MHKKNIFFLTFLVLLVFSGCFFNDFLGDDDVVIVRNDFYRSFDNIKLLFNKRFLTSGEELANNYGNINSSGAVSYRPIVALSFFLDRWIWRDKPFGYHFFNVLLHLINVLLIYYLIFIFFDNYFTALLCSMIFGLHPVQVEAVCSIGYRSDLIACFFTLLSFLAFIRARRTQNATSPFMAASLCFYSLALFSKESAVLLPVLFIGYDLMFFKKENGFRLSNYYLQYIFYFLILVFYLYIYFNVFPNTALGKVSLIDNDLILHLLTSTWIFFLYLKDIFVPFFVKMIPPLYCPDIKTFLVGRSLLGIGSLVLFLGVLVLNVLKKRRISSFLLWYVLFLLPVLNIFPNPNPIAHRYLYLPSIGIFAVIAVMIDNLCKRLEGSENFPDIKKGIVTILIFCFIITDCSLVLGWKNDYTVSKMLIENYPRNAKAHLILGIDLCKRGRWKEAKAPLERSLELGINDRRIFYLLGMCNFDDPKIAEQFFRRSIFVYPYDVLSYLGLGRLYFLNREYAAAIPYLEKGTGLFPSYSAYGYLIQSYIFLGQKDKAGAVLEKAEKEIKNKKLIGSLRKLLSLDGNKNNPVDIGI